jgi:hypothetical protein
MGRIRTSVSGMGLEESVQVIIWIEESTMPIAAEGAIDKEHSRTGLRAPGRETRRIPCLTKR